MPDYYDPYKRQSSTSRYKDLGTGYYQDLTTGQVKKKNSHGQYYDAEDSTEDRYERTFTQKNQFNRNLNLYDEEVAKKRDMLTQGFNQAAEYQGARQMGGLAAQTGLYAQRMGLGSDFTAALNAEQQGQLRQEIVSSTMDFQTKLGLLEQSERIGYLKGEFDYMHAMDTMDRQFELSKEMIRFQARLQQDMQAQQIFGDFLELGGTALGMALLGPPGAAAGNQIGESFNPRPYGR